MADQNAANDWIVFKVKGNNKLIPKDIGIVNYGGAEGIKGIKIMGSSDEKEPFEEWLSIDGIDWKKYGKEQRFPINSETGTIWKENNYAYLKVVTINNHGSPHYNSFYEFKMFGRNELDFYNRHKTTRYKRIVEQDDEKLGELGHGTFGVVYKAQDQVPNDQGGHGVVAVKRVELKKVQRQVPNIRQFMRQFKLERDTMEKCDSRYIVKYLDYYEAKKNIYVVMEYCRGGNLSDFISQNGGTLKQTVARYFSGQIAEALLYMKSMDIVHRDLKPENIVLTEPTEKATLKIADFGTAKFKRYDANTGGTILKTYAGTLGYMAPEIMSKKGVSDDQVYDSSVDLWSFGMIIYMMTTGSLKLKVKQGWFGVTSAYSFDHVDVSEEGRNLLTALLQQNPKDRKWEILKTNQWMTTDITNLKQTGSVNISIDFFICPLSKQIMRDPVIAFDGNTYERLDIEKHLKEKGTSPVTGEKAMHSNVTPNNAIKKQIELFLKANEQQQ